jgi:hypothetical protein
VTNGGKHAMPPLQYGDAVTRRDAVCRTTAEGVHVIIPTIGTARLIRAPLWARPLFISIEVTLNLPLQVLSLLFREVVWIRLFRFRPAVEVEVTAEELVVTDRRDENVVSSTRRWRRWDVAEFRPNRFGNSMWIRIPGREVNDVLHGLERPLLDYISEHVSPLLGPAAHPADRTSPP